MPIPVRDTFATDRDDLLVQVTDDGSLTLVRAGSRDAFHSGCGAISETRHVYLKISGVIDRIEAKRPTRVLEVGLGTAMGMLMTLDCAIKHGTELEYVALETDWISAATFDCLKPQQWVQHPELVGAYIEFRKQFSDSVDPGTYRWEVDSRRVVTIIVGDVRQWEPSDSDCFEAIYFDPFCPESAPELWTAECFRKMRSVIAADGRLTTYSCSRAVRDVMEQAAWQVDRVPGPVGGKREVIVARTI